MKGRFEHFTVLIAKINRCIKKIKTAEMEEYDLKSPHVSCLYYLYKEKRLTATELCVICREDKAAASRSLDYLEKNGYIAGDSEAKKRYRCPLTLTEKGEKIAVGIVEKIDRILEEASVGLSEERRLIMYESLALISDNLDKICENYEED
ncbi:MAG: hypothetical protein J6K86_02410 [Clostridia bacterium]|nr:hypothetical protein [Clostridia bacterium]